MEDIDLKFNKKKKIEKLYELMQKKIFRIIKNQPWEKKLIKSNDLHYKLKME